MVMKKPPPRPPIVLDPTHPAGRQSENPTVAKYKATVAERAAAQRAERPGVPDLATADQLYKPGKDGPMTIAQIGQAHKTMTGTPPEERQERGLSPQTIAGLQALQSAMQEQRKQMNDENPMQDLPTPAQAPMASPPPVAAPPPMAAPPAQAAQPSPSPAPVSSSPVADAMSSEKKARVSDALSELDDLEFERVLRGMQKDVINNEREREAVRTRVKPIDLIKGISTGEFTQEVPIIPNTLVVRYRTITPLENQSIRLVLFKMFDEDKRRENLGAELFGLMQTVCSVMMINGTSFGQHLKGEGYNLEFDEAGFVAKFKRFLLMPMPMIHALGTHGFWFEQRVREAFTTDHLKNG